MAHDLADQQFAYYVKVRNQIELWITSKETPSFEAAFLQSSNLRRKQCQTIAITSNSTCMAFLENKNIKVWENAAEEKLYAFHIQDLRDEWCRKHCLQYLVYFTPQFLNLLGYITWAYEPYLYSKLIVRTLMYISRRKYCKIGVVVIKMISPRTFYSHSW